MENLDEIINVITLIYVLIPLLALVVLFIMYLVKKMPAQDKLDKLLEFGKWYIASIALVFLVKMLENGFTERDTGIKEMQTYDKYADIILRANNIEERWKLSEYFSTVTPTNRLRDGWVEYRNTISDEYKEYKKLKIEEDSLSRKDSLNKEEKKSLVAIQQQLAPYEKSLTGTLPKEKETRENDWFVVFTTDKDLAQAQYEAKNLELAGVGEVRTIFRNNKYANVSQSFNSMPDALGYLEKFKGKVRKDAYVNRMSNWCRNISFNGTYYICN